MKKPTPENMSAAATAPASSDVKELRNAVNVMDALSQEGFSGIASIANLALISLENPRGYCGLENIARALLTIRGIAHDIEDCISGEAEQVGCNRVDEAEHRRYAAYAAARDEKFIGAE